jgi:tetratricopeptide (TPR) repeat protein
MAVLVGCQPKQKNMTDIMDSAREEFATQSEQQNKAIYTWDSKIEELYKRADRDLNAGVQYADSLIENDGSLDKWKVSNLNVIVGEIYSDNDSIDLALGRFYESEALTFDSPRIKGNKAGCFAKRGDFDKAMTLLEQAADVNQDFRWFIGNLYEFQGEPDKAIVEYQRVYQSDTVVYSYYNQRIQELKNNPDKLLNELNYKDRRKRNLLIFKGVDSDSSGTAIGRFEIEKK